MTVPSTANIFGAGHSTAPEPGGGGAGSLPPLVELPTRTGGVVIFPCATGLIDCCYGSPITPPGGTAKSTTDIDSYGGISGIIHTDMSLFLVGVFVGEEEPIDPAPKRLDFTDMCLISCTVERIEPVLRQSFFIGEGGEMPEYVTPEGATRLFLGIADAYLTRGEPGWYGNNTGQFDVVVRLP